MDGFAGLGSTAAFDALAVPTQALPTEALPSTSAPSGTSETADASTGYLALKRTLDVVLALVALVILMPLLVLVALLIRFTSRGPILFRQSRVGYGGRSFTLLKFRSMCADAEADLRDDHLYEAYIANDFKLQSCHETRVTPLGKILRQASLDELPQLINVLRGEMSLVGPRPVVSEQLRSYGDLSFCYFGVRPGITGIWQVSGRSKVHFPERAELDRDYFERRSIRLDLSILARTPMAVLRGNGAY